MDRMTAKVAQRKNPKFRTTVTMQQSMTTLQTATQKEEAPHAASASTKMTTHALHAQQDPSATAPPQHPVQLDPTASTVKSYFAR